VTNTPVSKPTLGEIGDLLAWCRRLSQAGPGRADAGELAAYQAAKADLLTRLAAGEHPHYTIAGGGA
jgi:hypothetical protein